MIAFNFVLFNTRKEKAALCHEYNFSKYQLFEDKNRKTMEKVNIRSLASYTHMLMDKIHEEVPSLIAFLTEKRHGQ